MKISFNLIWRLFPPIIIRRFLKDKLQLSQELPQYLTVSLNLRESLFGRTWEQKTATTPRRRHSAVPVTWRTGPSQSRPIPHRGGFPSRQLTRVPRARCNCSINMYCLATWALPRTRWEIGKDRSPAHRCGSILSYSENVVTAQSELCSHLSHVNSNG